MNAPLPSSTERLYGRRFALVFVMLFLYMCAHSMLVHLPKYVVALGGGVATVGNIFGLGMLGSFLARPFVGRWIDRAGCRTVVVAATLTAAAAMLFFPQQHHLAGVYALRVVVQLAQATLLATVAVLAARIAPPGRSAESLAMIGVGGLLGMMLGPIIGDFCFAAGPPNHAAFVRFFATASGFAVATAALGLLAPGRHAHLQPADTAPATMYRLVTAYWPGPILIMALCLAIVQTVPVMFIERFVAERGLRGVSLFFAAYAPTAVVLRLVLRRLPARLGRRRTLLVGLSSYTVALLLLVPVSREWHLLAPAILAGIGHCFSYPYLVDLAAERMPAQHRGLATAIVLAATDLGFFIAFVGEGLLVARYGFSVALLAVSLAAAMGVGYYAWTQRAFLATRPPRGPSPAV